MPNPKVKAPALVICSLLSAVAAGGIVKATQPTSPDPVVKLSALRALPAARLGVLVSISEGRREEVREIICAPMGPGSVEGKPLPQSAALCATVRAFAGDVGGKLGAIAKDLAK